jgi:predicted ABC-type transport system involved in lysophospholipase L1 biosynthesis ATPase subunit
MTQAIVAEEITKEFREGQETLRILRGISLEVMQGEIVSR